MDANTRRIGYYARCIQAQLKCGDREAELLEEIVRRHILHLRTLDWVRLEDFENAATEAKFILEDFRRANDMPPNWELFLAGENVIL